MTNAALLWLVLIGSVGFVDSSGPGYLDVAGEIDAAVELQRWMNWSMSEEWGEDETDLAALRGENNDRRRLTSRRECARALDQVNDHSH